jgi:hypothetical protein
LCLGIGGLGSGLDLGLVVLGRWLRVRVAGLGLLGEGLGLGLGLVPKGCWIRV